MNQLSAFFKKIKIQLILLYSKHRTILLLAVLFLILLLLQMFFNGLQKSNIPKSNIQELPVLALNKITPEGGVVMPEKLSFFFSDPIDEHIFEHSLAISPAVSGRIAKGEAPNQLDFIPDSPFPKGESYSVTVATGLTSKNGKTLLGDQVMNFSTKLQDNFVQFTKDEVAGKVLSFGANKPVTLKMRLSENLTSAKITLYKSNQAELLNTLLYKIEKKTSGSYEYSTEEYIKDYLGHDDGIKIESFDAKNGQEKKFNLKPGVYYIEGEVGKNAPLGSSFIVVNTLGVAFRQDDKKIVLSTFDLASGKKVSHTANLGFYKLQDTPQQLLTHTYSEMESSLPFNFDARLDAIAGTINGETIFIPVNLKQSMADILSSKDLDKTKKIFLYTDRPLYKPGDTVFFRGIARVDGDSLYSLPPVGLPIKIQLGYGDKPEVEMNVQTDAYGIFSGHFILPKSVKDLQYLYASADLGNLSSSVNSATAYFNVATYIKPEFEIKTSVNKNEFIRNDKAVFTISANYFDGKPYSDQEVSYAIYNDNYYETEKTVYNKNFNITAFGGMCGGGFSAFEEYYGTPLEKEKKVKLDKNGKAEVSFSLPDDAIGSKKIALVAMKKDKSENQIVSAANTIFHGSNYNIFFMPSAQTYTIDEEIVAPFYAESLTGEPISDKELNYKLVSTSYNSYSENNSEKTLATGKITTNNNGRAVIKHQINSKLKTAQYIVLEGKDEKGNLADARKYIDITDKEDVYQRLFFGRNNINQTFLNITSSQNNFKVRDKITLNVNSPTEIDALMSLERGRIYDPHIVQLNKGANIIEIPVGEDLSPSITVVFSFFAAGQYHSEGVSLNTPAMHKVMQVNVIPDKNRYKPFEIANIKVVTRDEDSSPIPAKLSMSVIDKALLTLKKNSTPPIHSSFYYFRPRTTNASSSLTWVGQYGGGGGGGGGGGVGIGGQAVDTLYWNADITTGTIGETILPVELHGFTTTWKVQVYGSSDSSQFGQGDAEFIVAK